MKRRHFLEALAGLSVLPARALADSRCVPEDDELIRFFIEESDRLGVPPATAGAAAPFMTLESAEENVSVWNPLTVDPDFQIMGEIINDIRTNRLWWSQPGREPPAWAALDESNDYEHLGNFTPPASDFELAADDLEFLVARNHFAIPSGHRKVLFGLRGCQLTAQTAAGNTIDQTDWAASHDLRWVLPNHMEPRCVIGVWDRDTSQLRLFRGSTVPEVSYMFLYRYSIAGCNLLPTGLYRYTVGTHRPTSNNPQHGAFRQAETVVVVRTGNDLVYKSNDPNEGWELGTPGDNIHAAHFYQRTAPPYFSSAGCQVIAGSHRRDDVTGPWATFRLAAGLSATPAVTDDNRGFRYMLLTGLEAALAAERSDGFVNTYRRVRFGSSGDAARELQQMLGVSADGDFRSGSVLALIRQQKANDEFESGLFQVPTA